MSGYVKISHVRPS